MDRPQTTERTVLIPVFERGDCGCAARLVGYVEEAIHGSYKDLAGRRPDVSAPKALLPWDEGHPNYGQRWRCDRLQASICPFVDLLPKELRRNDGCGAQ